MNEKCGLRRTMAIAAATAAGLGGAAAAARATPVLTPLASFNGTNGFVPSGPVTVVGGQVYGTTIGGGPTNSGVVYKVPVGGGSVSDVVTFSDAAGATGTFPYNGVVADAGGNLYGTTDDAAPGVSGGGYGTVFKIPNGTTVASGAGTVTTLRAFNGLNGDYPLSLAADAAGNLYGTTQYGGSVNGTTLTDAGVVFKVAANTTPAARNPVSTVVAFPNAAYTPTAGVTVDRSGNLYGVTYSDSPTPSAQIYEVPAGGTTLKILATVTPTDANEYFTGTLAIDSAGNLYGATGNSGTASYGSVYRVAAGTGTVTRLAPFSPAAGDDPMGGPTIDAAGDLFGTASAGGTGNNGTVWELPAGGGTIAAIATFSGATGSYPSGPLTADAAGNLYGATDGGGTNGDGTVFELTGSGFVVPEPASAGLLAGGGLAAAAARRRRR